MSDTPFSLWSLLPWLTLVPMVMAGLWIVVPRMHGLSGVPIRHAMIRRAMQLSGIQPGETIVDPSARNGRAVIIAAREYGARAIGVEIEPLHYAAAWLGALINGVLDRVSIRQGDPLQADYRNADVVLLDLPPAWIERVRPHLVRQLRPGARVVSLSSEFEGWKPSNIDIGHLIFLYHMPPQPGSIEDCLREGLP